MAIPSRALPREHGVAPARLAPAACRARPWCRYQLAYVPQHRAGEQRQQREERQARLAPAHHDQRRGQRPERRAQVAAHLEHRLRQARPAARRHPRHLGQATRDRTTDRPWAARRAAPATLPLPVAIRHATAAVDRHGHAAPRRPPMPACPRRVQSASDLQARDLVAQHLQRGVRGVAGARRHAGLQHLDRRLQPGAVERHAAVGRQRLGARPQVRLGEGRVQHHRLAGLQHGARGLEHRRRRPARRTPACRPRGASRSTGPAPASRLRTSSVRSTTAPGARPRPGAMARAKVGLAGAGEPADRRQHRRRRATGARWPPPHRPSTAPRRPPCAETWARTPARTASISGRAARPSHSVRPEAPRRLRPDRPTAPARRRRAGRGNPGPSAGTPGRTGRRCRDSRSLNSMQSNSTGSPSSTRMLARCRSPWQRRANPAARARRQQRPLALELGVGRRDHASRRRSAPSWPFSSRSRLGVGVDRPVERAHAALGPQRRRGVEAGDGAAQLLGHLAVDHAPGRSTAPRRRRTGASPAHIPAALPAPSQARPPSASRVIVRTAR